jgi:hypothetical protein
MKAIHGYVNISVKLEPIKIPEPIDKKKMYKIKNDKN